MLQATFLLLLFIWFVIFTFCAVVCTSLDLNAFLSTIISLIVSSIPWLIVFIKIRKGNKKWQEIFDSLDEQTKETISRVCANLKNEKILSPEFMDKNNILMILSYNFGQNNIKECILKDKKTNTICFFNLLSTDHNNVKFGKPKLRITQLVNANYTYNEERLVYTSATVGFVTTGGFHKEGGDYTTSYSLTGKYAITDIDQKNFLNEVYLNSNLTKKAQNSNMEKYIKGSSNCLYLLHEMSKLTRDTLNYALPTVSGNKTLYGAYNSLQNSAKNEMALTKAECEEVKDWLLSNMN